MEKVSAKVCWAQVVPQRTQKATRNDGAERGSKTRGLPRLGNNKKGTLVGVPPKGGTPWAFRARKGPFSGGHKRRQRSTGGKALVGVTRHDRKMMGGSEKEENFPPRGHRREKIKD